MHHYLSILSIIIFHVSPVSSFLSNTLLDISGFHKDKLSPHLHLHRHHGIIVNSRNIHSCNNNNRNSNANNNRNNRLVLLLSKESKQDDDSATTITTATTTPEQSENRSGAIAMLTIEYCTGCRWMLRSAWLMQELFTTFDTEMGSITLIPSKPPSPGGTFIIKLNNDIIWDRKEDNGFPEAKQLKQRVRDKIAPAKSLGHSESNKSESGDVTSSSQLNSNNNNNDDADDADDDDDDDDDCVECKENEKNENNNDNDNDNNPLSLDHHGSMDIGSPNVKITYCTGCRWMLRSAWMCQELLSTFEQELHSVTLVPQSQPSGTFTISIYNSNGNDNKGEEALIWDRKINGGFPEIKVLKQSVRNIVAPERDLGHTDTVDTLVDDEIDDDDAEQLRGFYGVL